MSIRHILSKQRDQKAVLRSLHNVLSRLVDIAFTEELDDAGGGSEVGSHIELLLCFCFY